MATKIKGLMDIEAKDRTPPPGSREALSVGCRCPVIDNCHGQGFLLGGKRVHVFNEGCPVHGSGMIEATKLKNRKETL